MEISMMLEINFMISQGILMIMEYGNFVLYFGKLEDLLKFLVKDIVMKVLWQDVMKVMDCVVYQQFNCILLCVVGMFLIIISLIINGMVMGMNLQVFNINYVKLIVDIMKECNIFVYMGDDYFVFVWFIMYWMVKNSFEIFYQYIEKGFIMIMNGEIGCYENVWFVEQINILKGGVVDLIMFNLFINMVDVWNGGYFDWIFFFGEDIVVEGIVVFEEICVKIFIDYGCFKGVVWYSLNGFGLVYVVDVE